MPIESDYAGVKREIYAALEKNEDGVKTWDESIEKIVKFYKGNEDAVKGSGSVRNDISEILYEMLSGTEFPGSDTLRDKYRSEAEEIVEALSFGRSEKDVGFIDVNSAKKDITHMMKLGKDKKAVQLLHTYEDQLNYRELVEAVVEDNFARGTKIPNAYVPKDIVAEYWNLELEYAAKIIDAQADSIGELRMNAPSRAALALTGASNITEKLGEEVAPITRKMMQLAAGFNKLGDSPDLWTLDKLYNEQKEQNPEISSEEVLIKYFSDSELMKHDVPKQFESFKTNAELSIPAVLRAVARELRERYVVPV